MNNLFVSIGDRARRRASQLKLKQHQVAEALGVSRSFVHELYTGRKRGISFLQLFRLCKLLKISADELLGFEPKEGLSEQQIQKILSVVETSIRKQTTSN